MSAANHDPNVGLPLPELVLEAKQLSERMKFKQSCLDSVGRLLSILAAASNGPILELGTGVGVSTAWLASANRHPIISFEIAPSLADAANDLFHQRDDVHIKASDFSGVDKTLRFALVFIDVAEQKDNGQSVIDVMTDGGVIVLDDFTPEWLKSDEWKLRTDLRREFWMRHEQLHSVEVLTTSTTSAIIATKRPQRVRSHN